MRSVQHVYCMGGLETGDAGPSILALLFGVASCYHRMGEAYLCTELGSGWKFPGISLCLD